MIRQFINDIRWKHLVFSVFVAFFIILLLEFLVAEIQGEAFVFWFNKGGFQPRNADIELSGSTFFNSMYWAPLHIITAAIAQIVSCLYLVRKTKGVELTNGIAHGLCLAIFIYQFNVMSSIVGLIISILVAYKYKLHNAVQVIKLKENNP